MEFLSGSLTVPIYRPATTAFSVALVAASPLNGFQQGSIDACATKYPAPEGALGTVAIHQGVTRYWIAFRI